MLYQKNIIRFNALTKLFEIRMGTLKTLRLPNTVDELLQFRLNDFDSHELKILQIAACIGPRVSKFIILELS
jgi:predicted ATPase